MSNLNSQLKDYLSNNSTSGSVKSGLGNGQNRQSPIGLASASSRFNSWVSSLTKDTNPGPTVNDESGNAWFTQAQNDPLLPSLTKKQRVLGFIGCLLMGTFCFSLASLYIPFLIMKARKFALLYTMGSIFIISSFSLLWGPVHHVKHLLSVERLPFTVAYFGTMFATLYFALSVQSTTFTIMFAVGQVLALVWYIVSYIPGGQTGLKFFTKVFYLAASKTVQKTLPI